MMALTPRQRLFVLAMMDDPFDSQASWARAAGYSDKGDACRVTACQLLQKPAIERAVKEVSRSLMNAVGPALATVGMLRIAGAPRHRDHFKALEALADRVGMHRQTQHIVSVTHTDQTGEALVQRIKSLAAVMGVDADKLLGENVVANHSQLAMKVIEHQPAETDGQD